MNKEIMYEAADAIEKEMINGKKHQFDMCHWDNEEPCQTFGCIAGTIYFLKRHKFPDNYPWEVASICLNVNKKEERHLFMGYRYDNVEFVDLNYIQAMKEFVPAALRWMADNDEINWKKALGHVYSPTD